MDKKLSKYFDTLYNKIDSNIKLDIEQINAIMDESENTLVIAGAGTGKTTTMVGKVKYLVDIKNVDPSKILVISYTKKAVEELEDLLIYKLKIPCNVTTFHSLAYKYVRNIFKDKKCVVVDYNYREKLFFDYMNDSFKMNLIEDIVNTFNKDTIYDDSFFYGNYFLENYQKYKTYDALFNSYKVYKIEEAKNIGIEKVIDNWVNKKLNQEYIITIKGELVKSVSEAVIANFLYKKGIDYKYEEVFDEIMDDRKTYRPDFTLQLAGEKIYLEYFGLEDEKYKIIKMRKIDFHNRYNNKFIYIENTPIDKIEKVLDSELKKLGFIYRDRTNEEIYEQILENNKLSQVFKLKNLYFEVIDKIKNSNDRGDYYKLVEEYISKESVNKEKLIKEYNYINSFYVYYSNSLIGKDTYRFDYPDLIYYANKYIHKFTKLTELNFEYIVIDEYQDISDSEYKLISNIKNKCNSKVFAVGDDWQSIYQFRGSNINYILRFNKYFNNPNIMNISHIYRNSQKLVDSSSDFIMKNTSQIDKKLISFKDMPHPIHFMKYDDTDDELAEYKCLKDIILRIHAKHPKHKILILARNNSMIKDCFKSNLGFIDDLGTKVKLSNIKDIEIDAMTIHKSKGLTYDEVIIIGLNKNFPKYREHDYWLNNLFKPHVLEENIMYPEERRLFYVALTRTKNNVFILHNDNASNRSPFVDELLNVCKNIEKKGI